jgi:signal transduction histidine kinase
MRFNDLLRTVLANGGESTAAAVTRWRQCIDLVAQYDVSGARSAQRLSTEDAEAVFQVLGGLCKRLGPEQRVAAIVELGGRLRSKRICRFLAQDHPAVVIAVMNRARLVDEDWAAIIPSIGPVARSVLRRRDDMGPAALMALNRFGPTDFALPSASGSMTLSPANDEPAQRSSDTAVAAHAPVHAPAHAPVHASETSDIRKIVERIERFTATRQQHDRAVADAAPLELVPEQVLTTAEEPVDAFTLETDAKGRFVHVEGVSRAAVVGLTIGEAALDGLSGADGQALGAFRRRAAFRDARFAIPAGLLEGEWRLSGEPRFDRASGLFQGYSVTARRELAHEQIVRISSAAANSAASGAMDWSGLSATGARQLIHELRTPLSAIYAYAEMIEGQLVGPVSSEYRDIANQILSDARELVTTFDDLDLAGRIARDEGYNGADRVDMVTQLRSIVQRFAQAGSQRITLETCSGLPLVAGDREQIERMLTHLVRAGYAALGEHEPLVVRMRHLPITGTLSVALQRPVALREHSEAALLDHSSSIDQMLSEAPPLGLAFALRLVRGIAGRMGGQLLVSADAFELMLPASNLSETGREQHP